jgi:ferredoxin
MDKKGYSCIEDFRGKMYNKLKVHREIPQEKIMAYAPTAIKPVFDTDSCIWCGKCQNSCIYTAIKLDKDTKSITLDENECIGCGFCAGICPVPGTVRIVHSKSGREVWTGEGSIETEWVHW